MGDPKIDFNNMNVDELRAQLADIRASRKRRTKRAVTTSRQKRKSDTRSTLTKIEKMEADGIVIDEV